MEAKQETGHDARLVDPLTLARALAVSVRTVRRLRASGRIPVVEVTPRRPRYCVDDVIAALEQGREERHED
jgi:hypothetical protein